MRPPAFGPEVAEPDPEDLDPEPGGADAVLLGNPADERFPLGTEAGSTESGSRLPCPEADGGGPGSRARDLAAIDAAATNVWRASRSSSSIRQDSNRRSRIKPRRTIVGCRSRRSAKVVGVARRREHGQRPTATIRSATPGRPYAAYVTKYGGGPSGRTLLVGMNPGPWGMAQTGIPFGDPVKVREWMEIVELVQPFAGANKRVPVMGFSSHRREVSGARLFSWLSDTMARPSASSPTSSSSTTSPCCF